MGGWNLGKVLPKIGSEEKNWSNFIRLRNASLYAMIVRKSSIWLPAEYGDFRFLLNTFGNCTKMSCFYWVLITIFNSSIHIFQKEVNADVKTASRIPLIQNQGFPPPPVMFQHLSKSTLYPKTARGMLGHMKKIKGG